MGLHHLMSGTWLRPGAIFTFEFDDEALTLKLLKRTEIVEDEPISWMAFSHDRKTIYGAALKKWTSFSVTSPTSIVQLSSSPMAHNPAAAKESSNTRAIFLLPAKTSPYTVYCNPFYKPYADHLTVFSTELKAAGMRPLVDPPLQQVPLDDSAGIHGAVFTPGSERYLYSADLSGNRIWVHARLENGGLKQVASIPAPHESDHPRWCAMHSSGNYLYVLMEKGNRICEYVIEPTTGTPVWTHHAWPLVPPGIPDGPDLVLEDWVSGNEPKREPPIVRKKEGKQMYRADVCELSHSGRYLFATSRANSFELTGYMAIFKLRNCGSIERQLHLLPTPTSGGHSNAVSPCPWSDEWLAITDDQEGWLEIYRWNEEFLHRVARCRVPEPGFGMNAIWYD